MTSRTNLVFIHFGLVLLLVGLPFLTLAQSLTYQPLVGIPGVSNDANGFNSYINQLYFLSISLAALLAVIKIIIGGVKWMLTDVVTSKSDAKNDIRSALLGLLLIVSAVLILGTINPQLRELNVLGGAPALNPLPSAGARQTGPATIGNGSAVVTQNPDGSVSAAPAQGFSHMSVQAQRAQEATCTSRNQNTRVYTYRVLDEERTAAERREVYTTRDEVWTVGRQMPNTNLVNITCS